MKQYYYAPSTQGFYCNIIHGENMPEDVISLTFEEYQELLAGQCAGRIISPPDTLHDKPYLKEYPRLDFGAIKELKLQQIDAETSVAILAGFEYTIDGKDLHFAYDTNDQQNFADTANMVNFSLQGIPGVPASIPWNGWNIEKDEHGAEVSRSLVRLVLDANAFLALYMEGAMMHKAGLMERGGQRKAQVDAATTMEELEAI